MKDFADDNLKFEEDDRKLFKPVETLWEKEKLLIMSNFSFPQCFQKACFPGASKGVIVWEWVKSLTICEHPVPDRNTKIRTVNELLGQATRAWFEKAQRTICIISVKGFWSQLLLKIADKTYIN